MAPPQPPPDREQRFVASALSLYDAEVRKAVAAQEASLEQLSTAQAELQATMATLHQLPARLRHDVMVPLGRHAFFPGQLTRTNELLVHLGDQYFVEATAGAARAVLQRRAAEVGAGLEKGRAQLDALRARLDLSDSHLGDGSGGSRDTEAPREIRSSLAESDALLASARGAGPAAAQRQQQQQPEQPELLLPRRQQRPQQQQTVQRVRSAAGYSYRPLPMGRSGEAAAAEAQQAADDAALQARLRELMSMEEQGLAPIEEAEEEAQEAPLLAGSSDAHAGVAASSAAAAAARLSTAQHLQQLESEPDSDDEEQQQPAVAQPVQQQQQQQRQQQQQQQPAVQPQAARGSGGGAPQPRKSALKKGFLAAQPARASQAAAGPPAASAVPAPAAAAAAAQPPAFTDTVVERSAGGAPEQAQPQAPPAKPFSKFKLRRLQGGKEGG